MLNPRLKYLLLGHGTPCINACHCWNKIPVDGYGGDAQKRNADASVSHQRHQAAEDVSIDPATVEKLTGRER